MRYLIAPTGVFAALVLYGAMFMMVDSAFAKPVKPTIVLVHGAFAESSAWNRVIAKLNKDGYRAIAAANPLRSVDGDAAALSALVRSIHGPVVLVGHSYGGMVVTDAANGNANVKALVYVAGFIPDAGESTQALIAKFPGSTLLAALAPVELSDGGKDFYIRPEKFHAQFAADVPAREAALMAAIQRPATGVTLTQNATAASWKSLPTYVIYGVEDRNIPAALEKFMAERAHARKSIGIIGGSHALMVSHPREVTALIEQAATEQ